jgi:hypothetical protein
MNGKKERAKKDAKGSVSFEVTRRRTSHSSVRLLIMSLKIQVTGIAWYREEDYDKLRGLFVDGNNLPSSFREWLTKAQALFDGMKREGHAVEKVYIDPETFPGWYAVRGMDIDSKARVRFANESVYRMHRDRQ